MKRKKRKESLKKSHRITSRINRNLKGIKYTELKDKGTVYFTSWQSGQK